MQKHDEAAPDSAEAEAFAPPPALEPEKKTIEAWGAEKLGVAIDAFTGLADPTRWHVTGKTRAGHERGIYVRCPNAWKWDGLLTWVGSKGLALGALMTEAEFDAHLAETLGLTIRGGDAPKQEG